MTQSTDNNGGAGRDERPDPLYHRPFFWLLVGLLAGALLLALLLKGCKEELPPPVEEPAVNAEDRKLDELILLQQAHNNGLEEEIRRLHGLLAEDPCTLSGILGASPEHSPVAPSYGAGGSAGGGAGSAGSSSAQDAGAQNAPLPVTPQDGDAGNPDTPPATTAPAPVSAPAPSTVGDLMDSATVFVLSSYQDGIGMGSGFFVAPGIIATNSHVVQNPGAEVIVGNKALGGMHEARVIAFSKNESRDYALLRVSDALAARAPVLHVAQGAKRTERVSAWGFPGYIAEIDPKLAALAKGDATAVPEVVYSEGVVSVVLDHSPPVILHTAALSQGNSGGPLINAEGVVVGINTFIKKADKSYSQTNIALPGDDLVRFMGEQGISVTHSAKGQE